MLTPLSCIIAEESCGIFELTLEQPIDTTLRWAQLAPGCILKAPIPTRESPLYEEVEDVWGEAPVQVTRNVWVVSGTTVGLYMRSGPGTGYKKYGYLRNGAKVNEIGRQTVSGRLWVHVIVQKGGRNCWMSTKWLKQSGTVTETLSQGTIIGQRSITYEQSQDQLFRIYSVERDAKEGVVTAKAMHIFYDLRANLVNRAWELKNATARDAMKDMFASLAAPTDFELHVAAGVGGTVSGSYGWKNPVECLLDPDEGMLPQARALLVRDNFDVFVLPDSVRDSGVTIRRGKNLKGAIVTEDASDIVTRIIPCGKDANGNDLFLDGVNYVDSPRIGDHPFPHVQKIDYDVKMVSKGADWVTTFPNDASARAKLRALAEADFAENGVDLPSYGMDVDFVLLQNTAEYEDYAGLQAVFLNDTVTVIDSLIGLTAKLRVTGYKWDALRRQYESVTLGDVKSLEQTVYSYNLPRGGVSGSKLAPGSVPGAALRDATIEYAKIAVAAIEQLTADSIVALTARIQEIVSQQITTDELYAALAQLNRAVIEYADIDWANIETLRAAVAVIAGASIGTADIGWGQIKDLISGTAIITEGEAGKLFISRLAVTEANMVSLTTGELVVKGEDGCFYSVTVDAEGNVKTELKQVSNDDVTDLSINAGEKLIEGSVTAACLNATDIFADSAVIRKMIAANLDVDELFAREAFVELLRTSRIVGEKSLEIVVRDTEAAQKAANAAIKGVDVEYYLSDSPTELSGGAWETVAPEWVDGKYMWSRTTVYPNEGEPTHSEPTCIAGATGVSGKDGKDGKDGTPGASFHLLTTNYSSSQTELENWATPSKDAGSWTVESTDGVHVGDSVALLCFNNTKQGHVYIYGTVTVIESATRMRMISAGMTDKGEVGAQGAQGATGVGVKAIVEEYYLSTSKTEQTGGNWGTSQPAWKEGCYLWTRSKITWTDGNTTTTEPVLADAINSANNAQVGGRNLIIMTDAKYNYWVNSSGKESYESGTWASDFIPVTPGEKLISQIWTPAVQRNWMSETYFDADKGYVGGYSSNYYTANHYTRYLTVPDGVAYIRCSYGYGENAKLKLEHGTKATDWTPSPEDVDSQINDTTQSLNSQISDANSRIDDCVTHPEQNTYMRIVSNNNNPATPPGVYVGLTINGERPVSEAFVDASGWFRVLQSGKSITAMGPRIQELGTLTIYETPDGGHGFI